MNKPSSTITAAGVGGLVAGVPLGMYMGGIITGLINLYWPAVYEAINTVTDFEAAVSGIVTVAIATGIGYKKKENVLK